MSMIGKLFGTMGRGFGLGLIAIYRHSFSLIIGPVCRHVPSCSVYGTEAISRYGLWAGGWITLSRLLRCHPYGSSGHDPVPDALPARARWYKPWAYGHWTGKHIQNSFTNSDTSSEKQHDDYTHFS
jgi:putative membrane protein insertion efficiency factor